MRRESWTRKMCLGEWPFIIQTRCHLIYSQKSTTVVFLQVRLGRLGTGYLVTLAVNDSDKMLTVRCSVSEILAISASSFLLPQSFRYQLSLLCCSYSHNFIRELGDPGQIPPLNCICAFYDMQKITVQTVKGTN